MSFPMPEPKRPGWHPDTGGAPVRLILSGEHLLSEHWEGSSVAGFPIELAIAPADAAIEPELLAGAAAALVEVAEGNKASLDRFAALRTSGVPLVAAAYEPSLAFVRSLVRLGAHDVIPLPVELAELETALDPVRRQRASEAATQRSGDARLVAVIKGEGGVGATALLAQLATRFAEQEAAHGREACLIDLDLQFGDAAFQLGLRASLTLSDLIAAGSRIDGELLRATTTLHPSGLHVVAAPIDILPLDAIDSEQLLMLIDTAKAEFGTVFVDLPANWTNWSLSLLARADIVLMVTELSVGSLNRARRQLDLLAAQGLGEMELRLVLNRFEKKLFSRLSANDVERVLGRTADFTVANDYATMTEAIERGVPLAEIRRKGPIARDLATLDAGLAAALGRSR